MADVTIRAKWDGRAVEDGLRRTTEQATTFKTKVAGALAGTAATAVTLGIINQLRIGFHGVVEEATAFDRLQDTITRRGGASAAVLARMSAEIDRLAAGGSRFEDTEIANALEIITETSGNAAGAIDKLSFAIDLAVAKRIDLARSAKITGFLMKGEIDQASRFAPEIRELSRNFTDLKGTIDLSSRAFQELADVTGAAESDRGTAAGNIAVFKRGVSELREAMVKGTVERSGFLEWLGKVGDKLNELAKHVEKQTLTRALEISPDWMRGKGPQQDPTKWFGGFNAPIILPQVEVRGQKWTREDEERSRNLTPSEILRDRARMRLEPLGAAGRVRGGRLDFLPMPAGRREEDNTPAMMVKKWREDQEELRNAIASTIEGGILAGAEGGFQGLLAYARDQVIRQLAALLAKTIATSLIPGSGGVGGGAFSTILSNAGVGVGGGGGSFDTGRGPVVSARLRSQELRMARIG